MKKKDENKSPMKEEVEFDTEDIVSGRKKKTVKPTSTSK